MSVLDHLPALADAGWEARRLGADRSSFHRAGAVPVSVTPLGEDRFMLGLDLGPRVASFLVRDNAHVADVIALVVARQPTLTRDNFREFVRDLVLAGGRVEAEVDGGFVPVTAEPADRDRRTPLWRRLFG